MHEINFITQDAVNGPFHTNDSILVCGSPDFGNDVTDAIELNQVEPGLEFGLRQRRHPGLHRARVTYPAASCRCRSRTPSSRPSADAGYVFSGETTIMLNGSSMTSPTTAPPSQVAAAERSDLREEHQLLDRLRAQAGYAAAAGCGNVRVSGTYNKDITIGADNDIIVTDDFKSSNTTRSSEG